MSGVIAKIGETQQKTEKFSVREFTLKTTKTWTTKDGEQGSKEVVLGFQTVNRATTMLDKYKVGQTVNVKFDIDGREYNDRVYTSLNAYAIDAAQGSAPQAKTASVTADDTQLPF